MLRQTWEKSLGEGKLDTDCNVTEITRYGNIGLRFINLDYELCYWISLGQECLLKIPEEHKVIVSIGKRNHAPLTLSLSSSSPFHLYITNFCLLPKLILFSCISFLVPVVVAINKIDKPNSNVVSFILFIVSFSLNVISPIWSRYHIGIAMN